MPLERKQTKKRQLNLVIWVNHRSYAEVVKVGTNHSDKKLEPKNYTTNFSVYDQIIKSTNTTGTKENHKGNVFEMVPAAVCNSVSNNTKDTLNRERQKTR